MPHHARPHIPQRRAARARGARREVACHQHLYESHHQVGNQAVGRDTSRLRQKRIVPQKNFRQKRTNAGVFFPFFTGIQTRCVLFLRKNTKAMKNTKKIEFKPLTPIDGNRSEAVNVRCRGDWMEVTGTPAAVCPKTTDDRFLGADRRGSRTYYFMQRNGKARWQHPTAVAWSARSGQP